MTTVRCSNCHIKEATHVCEQCKLAVYCGQVCQREHWTVGGQLCKRPHHLECNGLFEYIASQLRSLRSRPKELREYFDSLPRDLREMVIDYFDDWAFLVYAVEHPTTTPPTYTAVLRRFSPLLGIEQTLSLGEFVNTRHVLLHDIAHHAGGGPLGGIALKHLVQIGPSMVVANYLDNAQWQDQLTSAAWDVEGLAHLLSRSFYDVQYSVTGILRLNAIFFGERMRMLGPLVVPVFIALPQPSGYTRQRGARFNLKYSRVEMIWSSRANTRQATLVLEIETQRRRDTEDGRLIFVKLDDLIANAMQTRASNGNAQSIVNSVWSDSEHVATLLFSLARTESSFAMLGYDARELDQDSYNVFDPRSLGYHSNATVIPNPKPLITMTLKKQRGTIELESANYNSSEHNYISTLLEPITIPSVRLARNGIIAGVVKLLDSNPAVVLVIHLGEEANVMLLLMIPLVETSPRYWSRELQIDSTGLDSKASFALHKSYAYVRDNKIFVWNGRNFYVLAPLASYEGALSEPLLLDVPLPPHSIVFSEGPAMKEWIA